MGIVPKSILRVGAIKVSFSQQLKRQLFSAKRHSLLPSLPLPSRSAGYGGLLVGAVTALFMVNQHGKAIHCEAEAPNHEVSAATSTESGMSKQMTAFVENLQKSIVTKLQEVEGSSGGEFRKEVWHRDQGGQGISCVLQDGKVFEKAGVNISIIRSRAPETVLAHMRARRQVDLPEGPFNMFVAGISLVLHPHNPMAPTVHANYRYFELTKATDSGEEPITWWFGGGCDLTPSYLFNEDATHFHRSIKKVCDKHDPNYYPKFKQWCDDYFNIIHRGERRGIGGIFFDDLDSGSQEEMFGFVRDCGNNFLDQYLPILRRRVDMPFTDEQKVWQQLRRGRYVEFNLVHDRGTKFGLATPGVRIDNVLMSLPLTARWEYGHNPPQGSEEYRLLEVLRNPKSWV